MKQTNAQKQYAKDAKATVKLLAPRIEAGIKYLDKRKKGWLSGINEQKLSLANNKICILGQVFGDYWSQVRSSSDSRASGGRRALTEKESIKYGFYLESSKFGLVSGYDLLSHMWHCRLVALKIERGIELSYISIFN